MIKQTTSSITPNTLRNSLLTDLQTLSISLKKHSPPLLLRNNNIIQQLQLLQQTNLQQYIRDLLSHLSQITQIKTLSSAALNILNKFISFLTLSEKSSLFQINQIICSIINILSLIININPKSSQSKTTKNQLNLRVIQTIFSLLNRQFLLQVQYNLLIRLYSLCFECCTDSGIKNIGLTSLYCLTETIFSLGRQNDSFNILQCFLQYLLDGKRFHWIRNDDMKPEIWDLTLICIKNSSQSILKLPKDSVIVKFIIIMYQIAVQHIFSSSGSTILNKGEHRNSKKAQCSKNKNGLADYVQFYRTFVLLSVNLWVKSVQNSEVGIVPFLDYLVLLKQACSLEITTKTYIFLQGIYQILSFWKHFAIQYEKSQVLIEIMIQVSEQLRLEPQISSNVDEQGLYIDKMYGQIVDVPNFEFVRILKNTIITIRKNCFELQNKQNFHTEFVIKGEQKVIYAMVKIIKNLINLNYPEKQRQNQTHKLQILLQLQHWFIICSNANTKNYILSQILSIIQINNKIHISKVSQCLQIVSNIMYGFYQNINEKGFEIILEILSRISCFLKQSKGNDQLQQVMDMTDRLYTQQKLILKQSTYITTICGFVGYIENLLIDIQKKYSQSCILKRNIPQMVSYVLSKLQLIILKKDYRIYLNVGWGSVVGIFTQLCSSKDKFIINISFASLNNIVKRLIESQINEQNLNESKIIHVYSILSKYSALTKQIIDSLKGILPFLKTQQSIVQIFKTIKNFQKKSANEEAALEFQQFLMKQYLHKVKRLIHLNQIISYIGLVSSSLKKNSNLQYKLLTLLWCVADHLKNLNNSEENMQFCEIWFKLLLKFKQISLTAENCELKQSITHSLTQIIGESLFFLGKDRIVQIWESIYMPIIYDLLKIPHQQIEIYQGTDQNQQRVEMTKIGIKNYLKLLRKLITDNLLDQKNVHLAEALYKKISSFLLKCDKRIGSQFQQKRYIITDEYLNEICVLIEQSLGQPIKENHLKTQVLQELLGNVIISVGRINQNSLCFQKRVKPHLDKIQIKIKKRNLQKSE